MVRIILLIIAFFSFTVLTEAQHPCIPRKQMPPSSEKLCKKAKRQLQKHNTDKAISYYLKAIKKCPDCLYPRLHAAMLYYKTGQFERAAEQLEWLVSCNSGNKPEWNYFLADCYKKSGRYEMVPQPANKYLSDSTNNTALRKAAKKLSRDALFAQNAVKTPVSSNPVLMGPQINTPKNDYFPILTTEGNELIYTSRIGQREYLFHSFRKDGIWSKATPLHIIDNYLENGAHTVSPSGNYIIFSSCDGPTGYGHCDLYHIWKKSDGTWTKPANLGPIINSPYWEAQPSLGDNGQTLFFSSKRPGGKGGKDIYMSIRDKKGHWLPPVNLGAPINTPDDEQAPYYHPDGQTLYFVSSGHPGLGDFDAFISRRDNSGHWTTPINLGYPINSVGHEGCISISLDGREGFIVSDRKYLPRILKGDKSGAETNIYHFIPYPSIRPKAVTFVKAHITNALQKSLIGAQVTIVRLDNMHSVFHAKTDSMGEILACLPAGYSYAFHTVHTGYLPHSEHFEPPIRDSILHPFYLNISLDSLPDIPSVNRSKDSLTYSRPIVLQNVFFATGSAELKPQSAFELDKLVDLLRQYTYIRIRISGHTDNTGPETVNLPLSVSRAQAVCNYLIKKGIAPDRLVCKGYGASRPVSDNHTPEGRQKNRRTTFEIIK